MNCADVEILLAEYVDGTLHREARSAVKAHLDTCITCRDLAHDAAGAVAFIERASEVDAPPELVTRILFEVTHGPSRSVIKPPLAQRWFGKVFGAWLGPVFQPRFAMGMATTVLSLAVLIRARQLHPADLNPFKLWNAAEMGVSRTWERGVKYYENLRLVFEIQTRLKEWNEETAPAGAPQPASQTGGQGRENQK
ncbi:MAG: zf-HC2 domain-containing protein [Bryobacterales bacterium]|nr:zf-HC2 domain-containing protein [Bryobacterales bacterium]MBV9399134.1 zf-HC2 domain-containing protein [Bryobacterales bacterium]